MLPQYRFSKMNNTRANGLHHRLGSSHNLLYKNIALSIGKRQIFTLKKSLNQFLTKLGIKTVL